MNLKAAMGLLICASQLAACSTISGKLDRASRVNPAGVAARPNPIGDNCRYLPSISGDRAAAIDLDCFRFQPEPKDGPTAYQLATGRDKAGIKLQDAGQYGVDDFRQARNRLGFVLVNHADVLCEREKGSLYGKRAGSSVALDFLSSGFSITSTIVGGDQAKSILSGLAGLSTATRTNIDSNVYQNQLTSAITKVMDAERGAILDRIRAKQSQPISNFSADEMIVMANQYHQACSFQKGVQLLLNAAINKEGVDQIVRSMNLRQTIGATDRILSEMRTARTFDPNSPDYQAIVKARSDAVLQLIQIGQKADTVSIAPNEEP